MPIIVLNIKGPSTPIKRQCRRGFKQIKERIICCVEETGFKYKNTSRLNVKREKRYAMQILHIKKTGRAILMSGKIVNECCQRQIGTFSNDIKASVFNDREKLPGLKKKKTNSCL